MTRHNTPQRHTTGGIMTITEADANRHGITLDELDQHCLAAGFSPLQRDANHHNGLPQGRQWGIDLLANGIPADNLMWALAACLHTARANANEGIATMVARIAALTRETTTQPTHPHTVTLTCSEDAVSITIDLTDDERALLARVAKACADESDRLQNYAPGLIVTEAEEDQ